VKEINAFDVLIVGAGPAGVSCSIWLKQLGFRPLLLEKAEKVGGLQLENPYTNTWIATSSRVQGSDVANSMSQNISDHRVDTRLGVRATLAERVDDLWLTRVDTGEVIKSKFMVLATGVRPKKSGLKERLGLIIGPGVRAASTDYKGKSVAILGGGDSAFENYLFIEKKQPSELHIYARSIKARSEMYERVAAQNVMVGEFSMEQDENKINGKTYDHVLVMYGYEASHECLLGLDVALKADGFVHTDEDCETSIEGVFAIGEIARRSHPCCATSMADGVVAAKAIQRRLEKKQLASFIGMAKRSMNLAGKAFNG